MTIQQPVLAYQINLVSGLIILKIKLWSADSCQIFWAQSLILNQLINFFYRHFTDHLQAQFWYFVVIHKDKTHQTAFKHLNFFK